MFKKVISVVVAVLLLNLVAVVHVRAESKAEKESRFVSEVKEGIRKLGTGTKVRVDLRLRDKTKLKGHVSEAGEDSFVVVDDKTGATTVVAYPQVRQVKGNNLAAGVKIALGVAAVISAIILVAALSIPKS